MKAYSKRHYYDAVSELVNVIADEYGNEIKAIYAGGSFARGDFVPGRSDIDIYVVAKHAKEKLQKDLAEKAKEIEGKYFNSLKPVFDEVLGVTVTSLGEIRDGKSFLGAGFEYSNFIDTGKLLWGEDVKALIPKPSPEERKSSAENYLEKVYSLVSDQERLFKMLRWTPFRFMPKKSRERWTRQAFTLSFRTAALFLGSKGVYVSRKEDITSTFKEKYPKQEELCDTISFILSLWEKWKTKSLSSKETKQLLESSLKFVKGLQLL